MDWMFKDLNGRKGKYVIMEDPNRWLITFMVAIVLAVISYPGFFQTSFALIAYVAMFWWGIQEFRSGRSRFRKLLGMMGVLAVIGAVLLRLGF
jgi:energy-coupling factor transporter transmembrane protein EcfT